jgi:hypothetical protein
MLTQLRMIINSILWFCCFYPTFDNMVSKKYFAKLQNKIIMGGSLEF